MPKESIEDKVRMTVNAGIAATLLSAGFILGYGYRDASYSEVNPKDLKSILKRILLNARF